MWEQLKSGKLYTILCTCNNCVAESVFHHRLVGIHSEPFGADKGEEEGTYYGFGDSDDEESEDVEDDQPELRRRGCGGPGLTRLSRGKGR